LRWFRQYPIKKTIIDVLIMKKEMRLENKGKTTGKTKLQVAVVSSIPHLIRDNIYIETI